MYTMTYYSHGGLVIKDNAKNQMYMHYEKGEGTLNFMSTPPSYDLGDNSHY